MRLVTGPLVKLSTLDINKILYGHYYTAAKVIRGSYKTAPAAGTELISFTVPPKHRAAVLSILLDATEGNIFEISWTSGGQRYSYRLRLPADGVVSYDFRPGLNLDLPADPNTEIVVKNLNEASDGSLYKVDMLVGIWLEYLDTGLVPLHM